MQSLKHLMNIPAFIHRQYMTFVTIPTKYKFFFILLFGVVLLFYYKIDISLFSRPKHYIRTSSLNECLKDRLSAYQSKQSTFDAIVFHYPLLEDERQYFPFIGNGYFGCSWEGSGRLHLKHDRTLSIPTAVYPLFTLEVPDYQHSEATVIDLKDGALLKLQCFKLSSLCISTEIMSFAHRTRPGVLVQDVKIYNPTNRPVGVRIQRVMEDRFETWAGAKSRSLKLPPIKAKDGKGNPSYPYKVTVGSVPLPDGNVYLLAIAQPDMPEVITVKMTDTVNFRLISSIRYTGPMAKSAVTKEAEKAITAAAHESLVSALSMSAKDLQTQHTEAWNEIWRTGLTLSYSLAPNALNGDRINATLFYLLSSAPAPLHRFKANASDVAFARRSLVRSDHCYIGHNTLQASNLFPMVQRVMEVAELVTRWRITLEKQGCTRLMKAGADGVLQAVLLSLGAFHFRYDRLEFNMHPNDLHRDFTFRNIYFPISGHDLTVTVELDEGNRALLYVTAVERPGGVHGKLFACDAVCSDNPVTLSKTRSQLPIKITRPRTPILYVSSKLHHLRDLKMAIHVTDVRDAPAHAHHVISLHRHGHALGGLPMLFWILLISLVLIFHLFLIKLVYNEYCKGQANIPPYQGPPNYRNYRYHL